MMKFKYLVYMRRMMVWLNFVIVVLLASEFLFTARYISNEQEDYLLLNHLNALPTSAVHIFWQSIISFLILNTVMTLRHHSPADHHDTSALLALEFILACWVFVSLRMNYNGIFLLFFIDVTLSNRNQPTILHYRYWIFSTVMLLFLFTFSNYSFIGNYFRMPNVMTYVAFLPGQAVSELRFLNIFCVTLNIVFFIALNLAYINFLVDRQHQIQDQLSQLTKANSELQNYANLTEKIAENRERKRIARDIHDTVGHALTGIAAGIDAVTILMDVQPEAAKKQMQKISAAAKQGLKDVRQVLKQMRPGALKNYTLQASLTKMLKEYSDLSHVKINFNYHWGKVTFPKTTEDVIFRIIEETVTNSLRHGHASQIDIDCQNTSEYYRMVLHNNGKSAAKFKPGFGLTQMKERVAIINGQISFDGHNGFTTTVLIPKKGSESDD